MRLTERFPDASINEEERELLSAKVLKAVQAAGGDGARKVDFSQASTITDRVVDEFMDDRASNIEAAARAEAQARTEALNRDDAARTGNPDRDPAGTHAERQPLDAPGDDAGHRADVHAPGVPPAAADARETGDTPAPDRTRRKDLLRTLGKSELPGNLKSELRKLVRKGVVTDSKGLARHANRRTADWVIQNRVGRWYGEALKQHGARSRIKHGEVLMASESMLRQITESITGPENILNYPDIKSQSRALIAAHVRSEMDGRN